MVQKNAVHMACLESCRLQFVHGYCRSRADGHGRGTRGPRLLPDPGCSQLQEVEGVRVTVTAGGGRRGGAHQGRRWRMNAIYHQELQLAAVCHVLEGVNKQAAVGSSFCLKIVKAGGSSPPEYISKGCCQRP